MHMCVPSIYILTCSSKSICMDSHSDSFIASWLNPISLPGGVIKASQESERHGEFPAGGETPLKLHAPDPVAIWIDPINIT